MVEIKFCGMTRPGDARVAASLGVQYVGVIFADGPRRLDVPRARAVLDAGTGLRRVGVFGAATPREISDTARQLALDVVQLHGDPSARLVRELRRDWTGAIWAVQRVAGNALPPTVADLFEVADAVVLDAKVAGALGGSGVPLPWQELRSALTGLRDQRAGLVLAGGLRPDNVGAAIAELEPDIVDVSSGVESSPGVKDHDLMRAFRDAAQHTIAR